MFAKLREKHLSESLFFNKVADMGCSFIKKETPTEVRVPIPQKTSGRLIAEISSGKFKDISLESFNKVFSFTWILPVFWPLARVKKQVFLK